MEPMLTDYGKLHVSSARYTMLRPRSVAEAVQGWRAAPRTGWRSAGAGQRPRTGRRHASSRRRDAGTHRRGLDHYGWKHRPRSLWVAAQSCGTCVTSWPGTGTGSPSTTAAGRGRASAGSCARVGWACGCRRRSAPGTTFLLRAPRRLLRRSRSRSAMAGSGPMWRGSPSSTGAAVSTRLPRAMRTFRWLFASMGQLGLILEVTLCLLPEPGAAGEFPTGGRRIPVSNPVDPGETDSLPPGRRPSTGATGSALSSRSRRRTPPGI